MTTLEVLNLTTALLAGLVLGALFFGGLLWTVRKVLSSPRPALWSSASLLLRTGLVLAGFYFVGAQEWQRWAVCLAGFVFARIIAAWATAPRENALRAQREVNHAPES